MAKRIVLGLFFSVIAVLSAYSANLIGDSWILDSYSSECFPLAKDNAVSGIYYDVDDDIAVKKAVKSLRDDIFKVTGVTPQLAVGDEMPRFPIIVGTLGRSKIIDRLADNGVVCLDSLEGRWESFSVSVADAPVEGVDRALVIAGSDRRGTVFGIYELSRQLGVSPWYWWLDVPVRRRSTVYLKNVDYFSGEPAVKYRGIFINDEFPAMTSWAKARFGGMNSDMYANMYELLLRLRANCLWPAMWGSFKEYKPLVPIFKDEDGYFEGNCFNEDDPMNPRVADEYGIVIGTSHHEPMQRSQQEWIRHKNEYGNGEWNYMTNRAGVEKFFFDGISKTKDFESIVTVGMRGEEDCPMVDAGSAEANFRIMQNIIGRQRKIIEKATGKPASHTPQVWTLYSEVLDYYDQGLEIPDDVIVMFCDDNFGNVRRLPSNDGPKHPGGYGMYYHLGYYGAPRACKWLNTIQIQHIWEQMDMTLDHGVKDMWMLNVGDLKPHEFPIDFFMEMAWCPDQFDQSNLLSYTRRFCSSVFGSEYADEAAYLMDTYNKCASWINPELLDHRTYSLENGEFEYAMNSLLALEARSHRLEKVLPEDCRDSYRQLLGYPVEALANLYDMYFAEANYYKVSREEGSASAAVWADRVDRCFTRDSLLNYEYNNVMSGGKWLHMMDQPHIGYKSWHGPEQNVRPRLINRGKSGSGRGGYKFKMKNGEVIADAEHYFSYSGPADSLLVIPNLGRWRSGIGFDYSGPSDCAAHALRYDFNHDAEADSVYVTLIMKSTMPFLDGGHYVGVALDSSEEVSIAMNQNLNWEHKYDLMYPTGASRVIRKTVKLPLGGEPDHSLSVRPMQEGIVLYKLIISIDEPADNRLLYPESRYVKQSI